MLDRKLLRENPQAVIAGAARKRIAAPVDEWVATDAEWRRLRADLEEKQAESNRISKSIGQLIAEGKKEEAEAAKAQTGELKRALATLADQEREVEARLRDLELSIPNLPHESVPDGTGEEDNVVVREWGEKPVLDFEPRPHWEIAEELRMLDLPRAAKISGSGFALYTGYGARLQRSLFTFMADHQSSRDYLEIYPPYLVNSASLIGTGQLPKFGEDLYKADEDLYLIPTAEVPVTNMYRDEILEAWMLPMKFCAYSGCFRKEAGAAGKDTRGIQRIHQFDKVELVKYSLPENSYEELESMVEDAESVLQELGLHYRVSLLCAPEMSFSNAKCYDLEVWSPGLGRYLEISSCSNFEAFQARRANIRFRRGQGESPEFVHVLNGSGLATPRLFSAICETFYRPGEGIQVPDALRQYMGVDWIPVP